MNLAQADLNTVNDVIPLRLTGKQNPYPVHTVGVRIFCSSWIVSVRFQS